MELFSQGLNSNSGTYYTIVYIKQILDNINLSGICGFTVTGKTVLFAY